MTFKDKGPAIFDLMNKPGGHYPEENKPDTEGQIDYDTLIWKISNKFIKLRTKWFLKDGGRTVKGYRCSVTEDE